jgi:hypothetical protein
LGGDAAFGLAGDFADALVVAAVNFFELEL